MEIINGIAEKMVVKNLKNKTNKQKELFVKALCEEIGIDIPENKVSPVSNFLELKNNPNSLFVWKFKEEVSDTELTNIFEQLKEAYIQKHGSDPESIHFFTKDVDYIKEFDKEEVMDLLMPWIKSKIK